MSRTARLLFLYSIFAVWAVGVSPQSVFAAVDSCAASVSPSNVTPGSSGGFSISFTNSSAQDIAWIQITRPSSNFTITGNSIGGWTVDQSASTITMTGTTMAPSGGASFDFTVTAGGSEASSANWTVTASDDGGGASPTTCTGSLGTSISATPPDTTAPEISNIVVSDVRDSRVTITWTTDESANSVIDSGTTDAYGTTTSDSANVTSHNLTITGLSANTTYHYNVKSTDGSGNTAESGDNTFTTAVSGTTGTTTTGTVTTRVVSATPTPTPVPDRTPPAVRLTTELKKSYTSPPVLSAKASDPSGVSTAHYSLDGGINWLPVDEIDRPGKSSVTISFSPVSLEDGNYDVVVRASDTKGNVGKSAKHTMVIDRLPPQTGTVLFSVGSQVIEPSGSVTTLISGMEHKVTVSAVGGPTEISLSYLSDVSTLSDVSLKKNSDTGLWSGTTTLSAPGVYTITARAVDGAENRTVRPLGTVMVIAGGKISDGQTPVTDSSVTLYFLDTVTKQFMVWDGPSYGQKNPSPPNGEGSYGYIVPPGTYYIRVESPRHRTLVSDIFTLGVTRPIVQDFTLKERRMFRIGPWSIVLPDFRQTRSAVSLTPVGDRAEARQSALVGGELPFFRFPLGADSISSLDLRGKTTLITLFSTWAPSTSVQLAVLDQIAAKQEFNTLGIVPQEKASSVSLFAKRGLYATRIVADPDGTLIESLGVTTSPTHIVVDRKGVIRSITSGVLSKEELLDTLIQ